MTRFTVPAAWMPDARIERVILHWTGGRHKASGLDREHYHVLVEGDGGVVLGEPPISANGVGSSVRPRAAHTLNCNTGSIGVSMCAMGGDAREFPYNPGPWPLTRAQWEQAAIVVAQLCARYRITVSRETVLSHAEVQGTLGIRQRGKWDVTRLPFDPLLIGARPCGDAFRTLVSVASLVAPTAPPLTPSSRSVPATLREGASGRFVTTLQLALTRNGYAVATDGHWGPITTRALKEFQKARKLHPDGVAGPATWEALLP